MLHGTDGLVINTTPSCNNFVLTNSKRKKKREKRRKKANTLLVGDYLGLLINLVLFAAKGF